MLCTYKSCLPQGAPTSPAISNVILYDFDQKMNEFCGHQSLWYSRYADDITISGDNKLHVRKAISRAESLLQKSYSMRLNRDKTRISSRGGQQRVTGVVVNSEASPPRTFRRRVRAAFHHASLKPKDYIERISELGGYIGYLKNFPRFEGSREITEYEKILINLRAERQRHLNVGPSRRRRIRG